MELGTALREAISQFQSLLLEHYHDNEIIGSRFSAVVSTSHTVLDRSQSEQSLKNELNKTKAQSARLEGEIARMRRRAEIMDASRATESLIEDSKTQGIADPQHRKALLEGAIPAAHKESASIVALQSELDAKERAIEDLEQQLQVLDRDAGMRVANLQDSFLLKLEHLKAAHSHSMMAKESAVKQYQQQAHAAEAEQHRLRAEVSNLKEVVKQLKADFEEKQQQCKQQDIDCLHLQQEGRQQQQQGQRQCKKEEQHQEQQAKANGDGQQTAYQLKEQSVEAVGGLAGKENMQQQQCQGGGKPIPSAVAATPAAAVDVDVVQAMESQLVRLSVIIRAHEAELQQLRPALAAACADRHQLQLANAQLVAACRGK